MARLCRSFGGLEVLILTLLLLPFSAATAHPTDVPIEFIDWRYRLALLTDRDIGANNLMSAFDVGPSDTVAARQGLPSSGRPNVLLLAILMVFANMGAAGYF